MSQPMLLPALWTNTADDRPREAQGSITAAALCAEQPRLRRLVHRLLGWRARAADLDDLVQDVLLRAWRARDGFRGDAQLATWLCRIALGLVHDHARRQARHRRLFGWLLPAEPPAPIADDPIPHEHDEPLDRTRQAMQLLAHADREVLVLRYLEQRDIDDIAVLRGISRAAIDARLSRARQRLRERLATEAP